MSVREICVQYLGSVLRLPVAIEDADLAKATRLPFGRPVLEREVEKVVLTQPDGSEQTFVPEARCGMDGGRAMSIMPCPLCGREMTAIETYAGRGELYCGHCDLTIGGNEAKTPDELTALLGQGTCHTVAMDCFGNPPYNQSGLNGNSTACGCSECGAPWSTMGMFRGHQFKHNFKACPICGRRVVSE